MKQLSTHPRMSSIPVAEAVGTILCHDITGIVPGVAKGPVFRKGHSITEGDIPTLLKLGKEHIFVYQPAPGFIHEEEAALRLAAAGAGRNLEQTAPKEGRVNFKSTIHGLLSVNVSLLQRINSLGQITFATLHTLREVQPGESVAGVRVVPLMIEEGVISRAEGVCAESGEPVLEILPFRGAKIGVVVTGSEIYHGRIKDRFGPVLREKFSALGCTVMGERATSDDIEMTKSAILSFASEGADMIVATGGMSVDPDDLTPASIRAAGAVETVYGAPVFPGAMFLLASLETSSGAIPILGLPGCVMYHRASIFDLVVPRLLAGVKVGVEEIAELGHGGFCANCAECVFPACGYGKG